MTGIHPDPNADPAVQAAYAAHLDAWTAAENLPGGSAPEAVQAAEYRLYEADKNLDAAWHAAYREMHPELYRDDASADGMTLADWQEKYPLIDLPEPEIR